jgi:protein PhnA
MKIQSELANFFLNTIADGDPENDVSAARAYAEKAGEATCSKLVTQLQGLAGQDELALDELGTATNRWFGEVAEAQEWLGSLRTVFDASANADGPAVVVKDSNGAVLAEGDSVLVIKDLKVKGGSSDLKRGTLIRKIHLIDDAENIECRVDGSTLVLKTCFLKKA